MCMAIIGAGLGLVMTVAQASVAQSAKQADYNAKVRAWQQNVINSEAAARDEQRQILTRQLQEQAKASEKEHVSYLEEAQKRASAEVSAAAANVSGISLDNLLDDISQKSLYNRSVIDTNYKYLVQDTQEKLKASDTRLMARINSVEQPIEPADTSGIEILGGAVNAFGKINSSFSSSGSSFAM